MSDEREIRRLIENWVEAVRRQDLEGVAAAHTDDVVMFDVPPPVALHGLDAYVDSWPPFFEYQRSGGIFELTELDVTAGDRVAFATALLRCGTASELAADPEPRLRLTIGLRKVDGAWAIAHEHHSFPSDA